MSTPRSRRPAPRTPAAARSGRGGIGQRVVRRLKFAWRTSIPFRVLVAIVALALVALGFSLRHAPTHPLADAPPVAQDIAPSAALEMAIPRLKLRADFSSEPCHIKDGAIDPKELGQACTYTAPDKPYVQPGTSATDVVVIAGHTAAGRPAVFNKLYDGSADHHNVEIGDSLYVRTEASGTRWLEYKATDLHDPEKEGLSNDPAIWGTAAQPGRLLTISCIQPANPLAAAVRNAVVGWQLQGVVDAVPAA